MVQVTAQYLKTVAPLKNDGVKVLSGEYRGALCILTAVDVYDGIFKLRGENTYKVLAISVLAQDKNIANTEEQDDSQMFNAD
ncbi:hypothetical protein K457DRAFT_20089 [Linnemannia elongata AG-77]|uniref:Spt5 KOW domain-containing protein n=1 Tax=Linnemannia elongata AG-77 TaxID=1314771 RepID=A0A197JTJ7_9FUNG|nr:hypothetical protein K457DRAFT_20089 [Linnemannia elongata AG-77]